MEGAGVSIVCHAAETRGMNSADEKPEVPSAVQDLIRRLEGKGEPMTSLPNLNVKEFQDFLPESTQLSTITGWRSQVRLQVLKAIGNCNTFEFLYLSKHSCVDISRLTASEWELVLGGFMSNTVLREINIRGLEWISDELDEVVESWCLQIGRILNSSSVTCLTIENCTLSAKCFSNLASGLRENSDSKLQWLKLHEAWEDSSVIKHVADMINSATRLESLRIRGNMNRVDDMEEETVGILSQALIQSSSLKELDLVDVKWGAALLLNVHSSRSIERLLLHQIDRLGGCLGELLTSNPSLKEVRLSECEMSPEEWKQLGEVIRDNAIATTIHLWFFFFESQSRDEWESIEALVCGASSDVKDPVLELVLKTVYHQELMLSLILLGRVLRGEIKSVKSLSLPVKKIEPFRYQPK